MPPAPSNGSFGPSVTSCCAIEPATQDVVSIDTVCQLWYRRAFLLGQRVRVHGTVGRLGDYAYLTDPRGAACKEAGTKPVDIFFLRPGLLDCCSIDGDVVVEARVVRPDIDAAFSCTDCSDVMLTDVVRVAPRGTD